MLEPIVESTRRRIAERAPLRADIEAGLEHVAPAPSFRESLVAPGLSVIAEIKRRSPSAGTINTELVPVHLAQGYQAGGAAAISVLTEPEFFGGSLGDLATVAAAVETPALRKDFILDEMQLVEARVAGAAAVLLIVAILDQRALQHLVERTGHLGMAALVEAHDGEEVRRALDAGADVVGINNRNLRTFEVDIETSLTLRPAIPERVVTVAESGIGSSAEAGRMYEAGYDAVLVGQAAASASDPAGFVRSLRIGAA